MFEICNSTTQDSCVFNVVERQPDPREKIIVKDSRRSIALVSPVVEILSKQTEISGTLKNLKDCVFKARDRSEESISLPTTSHSF